MLGGRHRLVRPCLALNQSGYAIEIVAITMLFYMTISLTISFFMNIYNKRVQLRER